MLPDVRPNIIGERYELADMLGQGGMGTVYRAKDRLNGAQVALKRVLSLPDEKTFSSTFAEGDFRLALAREFKLLASLRHPNIIEVLDYGFDQEQQPYFTMELLENAQTIIQATRNQPLNTRLTYIVQMLQALAYLHRREILHRDLKPANVIVVNGQVKVLDFGLSVMRDHTTSQEDDGNTAGTLSYMAPEILIGNPASEAADLYAVGMIAYEMLAGFHPFDPDNTDPGTLINHVLYTMPDVERLDVVVEIASVVEQLLQKDPEVRYTEARAVIDALDEASGEAISVETAATRESFLQAARLIGREQEIAQLTQAIHTTFDGAGSAWLIGGEAGVGKSRLVDEIRTLAMVNGALVMRGQTVSEGRLPYHVWHPVLRWLALLADLNPTQAGLIKLLAPDAATLPTYDTDAAEALEPQQVQVMLLDILKSTLQNQTQPTVIILEDLHWANSESISMLAQLNQHIDQLPLLLITSFRDDERPDLPELLPDINLLKLDRLSEGDISRLSEAMLGESGTQPDVVHLLQRETEGNVFFLIEVVRALADEAGRLDQIGRMTLPQNVFAGGMQLIIQRRLDNLSPTSHTLLNIAAVIGRQIDLSLMRYLHPADDLGKWLVSCADAAVLEVLDNQWRFAHDKLRDGVLERLSEAQRRELNRQVAYSIEALYIPDERAAVLAHHWRAAGDAAKEAKYVILAGEKALHSGAYEEAVNYFERALILLDANVTNDHESQMRRVELQHRSAEAYLGFGGYDQARELYETSLAISENLGDKRGIASSLYALGNVHYALNTLDKARQYYQRSLTLYEDLDEQSGIARALNSLGNIAYDQGDQTIAKKLYQQSLTLSREIGDQWGMAGSARAQESAADHDESAYAERLEAQSILQSTLDAYLNDNDTEGIAQTSYKLGEITAEINQYERAIADFTRALDAFVALEDTNGITYAFIQLGMVAQAMQNQAEAMKYYRKALKAALRADEVPAVLEILLAIARLRIQQEQSGPALEILAFLLSYEDLTENIEDTAEQLVFDLEETLAHETIAHFWEQGKAHTYDSIIAEIL